MGFLGVSTNKHGSIDWFFREKLQEHPMIFMGKSGWFPVKIFPSTNPLRLTAECGFLYMDLYM